MEFKFINDHLTRGRKGGFLKDVLVGSIAIAICFLALLFANLIIKGLSKGLVVHWSVGLSIYATYLTLSFCSTKYGGRFSVLATMSEMIALGIPVFYYLSHHMRLEAIGIAILLLGYRIIREAHSSQSAKTRESTLQVEANAAPTE